LLAEDGTTIAGVAEVPLAAGEEAVAVFRPSAVAMHLQPPHGSPRNVMPCTVTELEPQGHLVRVRCGALSADVTAASVGELGLGPGVSGYLAVKAAEVGLYRA
jgi:molybdate transport system ATP-binding protein